MIVYRLTYTVESPDGREWDLVGVAIASSPIDLINDMLDTYTPKGYTLLRIHTFSVDPQLKAHGGKNYWLLPV